MLIKTYINKSRDNSLTKNLEYVSSFNANLYNSSDVQNLMIKVRNKTNANYCSVEGYGLYFIVNQITDSSQCILVLSKDVLTSNKSEILATTQLVSRNEYKYNPLLPDSLQPITARKFVKAFSVDTPLNKGDNGHNFILGVVS